MTDGKAPDRPMRNVSINVLRNFSLLGLVPSLERWSHLVLHVEPKTKVGFAM